MTKKAIAQYIKSELANDEPEIYLDLDDYKIIAETLEQESIDYKTQYETYLKKSEVVISQLRVDRDRLQETIDKARAEIKQEYENEFEQPYGQGLGRAMEIIDKYNKEEVGKNDKHRNS